MSTRLFGTDGVRGVANRELTPNLAFKIAFSTAYTLFADRAEAPTVIIGHDTRISKDMLQAALIAGFCSAGAKVILAGTVPTPGIAWLCREHDCDLGVVISASHNSFEHNGIKIFNHEGYKLPDSVEDKIEANLQAFAEMKALPIADNIGVTMHLTEAADEYREHLLKMIKPDLRGMKLVIDTANGAAYHIAPKLFAECGATLICLANEPNGININENCGSTHVENLSSLVLKHEADVGLAFDGDADRLLAVDDKGEIMDGDIIMAIMAKYLHDKEKLRKDTLVVTVMSNLGLDVMAKREGIKLVKTKVGDRYVLEEMLKHGYILGGEQSGHMISMEHSTTGDGMLSALRLLAIMRESAKPLSELRKVIDIFPQVLLNVDVPNSMKAQVMEDEDVKAACHQVEAELGDEGRILLRPSGTEPKIRIMIEGKDIKQIRGQAESLARLVASKYTY